MLCRLNVDEYGASKPLNSDQLLSVWILGFQVSPTNAPAQAPRASHNSPILTPSASTLGHWIAPSACSGESLSVPSLTRETGPKRP